MQKSLCNGCYLLTLDQCDDVIVIPTGLGDTVTVYWEIEDKFGNIYYGDTDTDADGFISLDKSQFTKSIFTKYSGKYTFTVTSVGAPPTDPVCSVVDMTICDDTYNCVTLEFTDKTEIV